MRLLISGALVAAVLALQTVLAQPPAAAPATPATPATPAATHYVLDPAKSSLDYTFVQAGAANKGRFTRFQVAYDFAPESPAASRLDVTVDINSLDTGDQERDDTLRGADLFAVAKFPQAHLPRARSIAPPRATKPSASSRSAA